MAKKSTSVAYGTQLKFKKMRSNHPIRSRYMAAVLAILLGFAGVHHFYLNNFVKGLLMIVLTAVCVVIDILGILQFSFVIIPVVISVLTGLIYLMKSDAAFAKSNHVRTI